MVDEYSDSPARPLRSKSSPSSGLTLAGSEPERGWQKLNLGYALAFDAKGSRGSDRQIENPAARRQAIVHGYNQATTRLKHRDK
jgi:hypothetical protein